MPNLPLLFARRYLFSRKSLSVINIISGVSALTVAVPVMAMVILLSVFNGFDSLIKSMYRNFDPEIRITAAEGKFFDRNTLPLSEIRNVEGVEETGFTLEENALFEYGDKQYIGSILGVDSLYDTVVPIRNMVVQGEYRPKFGDLDQALIGQGVAYNLTVGTTLLEPLVVYMPRRGTGSPLLPVSFYRKKTIFPSGIFALDNETDSRYVIAPIGFVRELLEYGPEQVSSAILRLAPGSDPDRVRARIAGIAGDDFRVQTSYQQKESLYRIMQYEKWGIYFIILMVLVIASFSIVGSLIMIIIDKQKDTETLITLGAERKLIRRIFVREGMLISGIGMAAGLVLGIAVCLLQQHFGWIKMAGSSFLVDAYPVEIETTDLLGIVLSVGAIGWAISRFTVGRLISARTGSAAGTNISSDSESKDA